MDMRYVRDTAKKMLKGCCRVCPVCNGKACAGEIPGMGGRGTGESFTENVRALSTWKLNLRTLYDEAPLETSLNLWGARIACPIMGAPMSGVNNLANAFEEEYLAETLAAGCKAAETLCWIGDGSTPDLFAAGLSALKKLQLRGIATIKPRPVDEILTMIRLAEEANALAIAIDVDAAAFSPRGNSSYRVGPTSARTLELLVSSSSLPLILKGIMTVDEARLASSLGVAAIVVSNHGGRSLEASLGTADVLPGIADAVGGAMHIFCDGGIRSGADVLKVLALGADAVLVGRPLIVGCAGGAADGVCLVIRTLHEQLMTAMLLTGVKSTVHVSRDILARR